MASSRQSYRVVLLGDQGVGKSSLAHRFINNEYIDNNSPTVGAAYLVQSLKVGEQTIKLDIWDTAGQERFAPLAPMYYRTAQAAIIVYDVCCKTSFDRALVWLAELRTQGPQTIFMILCGNKVDRPADERQVKPEEAARVASEKGMIYMEVSAKTGQAVHDIFAKIAVKLAEKSNNRDPTPKKGSSIGLKKDDKPAKSCACSS